MRDPRLVRTLGLLAAVSILPAQAPVSAPQGPPSFRSRTDLVLVPVVVTKDGKHVEKLSKSAFIIREDGSRREIAGFEEIKLEGRERIAPKLGVGVFSNAPAVDRPQHITIILLDLINLPPYQKQAYSSESLIRFLLGRPGGEEVLLLAALTPVGLRVIHSVTQDPRELIAALETVKSKLVLYDLGDTARREDNIREAVKGAVEARGGSADSPEVNRITKLLTDTATYFDQRREMDRTRETLRQMRQLASALSGMPGRKSMIWVTGGLRFYSPPVVSVASRSPERNYISQDMSRATLSDRLMSEGLKTNEKFDLTWTFLNDANIAVYPIDLSDVVIPGFTEASFMRPQPVSSELLRTQTMVGFSQLTGGSYCGNQVPLEKCLRDAGQDSAQYYLLSFYAGSESKPGWHKLQVKVDLPGARVHARQGYTVRAGNETEADRGKEIAESLVSPIDATGVLLAVHWLEPPSPGANARFELFVDPNAIAFDGDRLNHFKLSLASATVARDGDPVGNLAKTIEATLTPEALKKVQSTGVLYRDAITLPANAETVRFVIRDEIAGRVGSVTASIK